MPSESDDIGVVYAYNAMYILLLSLSPKKSISWTFFSFWWQEDELSKSISSCRTEADVLITWLNFLEDTWVLQCSYTDMKEKQLKCVFGLDAWDNTPFVLLSAHLVLIVLVCLCIDTHVYCLFAFWSDELERHEDYFVNLVIHLLSAYKVFVIPFFEENTSMALWYDHIPCSSCTVTFYFLCRKSWSRL